MRSYKERLVLVDFIKLYRGFPCLWNTESEAYKDREQRNIAWSVLADKLKEFEPNSNVATAKKKVEHLRTAYKREYRKVLNSKRSGDRIHVPCLWYYDLLSFIHPNDDEALSENETVPCEPMSIKVSPNKIVNTHSSVGFKRKRENDHFIEHSKHRLLKAAQDAIQQASKKTNHFGIYVGEQLLQIDNYQRQIAEKLISDVIFLARTENLNIDSRVHTDTSFSHSIADEDYSPDVKPPLTPEFVQPCSSPESSRSNSPAQYIKLSLSPEPSPSPERRNIESSPERNQSLPPKNDIPSPEKVESTTESVLSNTPKIIWSSPAMKIVQTSSTFKKIRMSPTSQSASASEKVTKSPNGPKIVLSSSALKPIRLSTGSNQPSSSKIIWSPKKTIPSSSIKRLRVSKSQTVKPSTSQSEETDALSDDNCTMTLLKEFLLQILKNAKLANTSTKKVIQKLEADLGVDLSEKKKMIDELVMDYVNNLDSEEADEDEEEEEEEEHDEKDDKNDSDWGKSSPKKRKAEEKKKPVTKAKKKKTGGGGAKGSGYTRAYKLSPALAELMGTDEMPRHEVVKRIWGIIKEKNLYDPNNRRFVICDKDLLKVIGTSRFRAFGMMKYLKTHFLD